MIRAKQSDVLLVGPGREADSRALESAGLGVEHADSSLDAILLLGRRHSRVVVLSARDSGGHEDQVIASLKEAGGDPLVVLTLPPHRQESPARVAALGADDILAEPYFPEDLVGRIRKLLRRARGRERGLLSEGVSPLVGSDILAAFIEDLADLNRHVPNLDAFIDALLDTFARRSGASRISLFLTDRKSRDLTFRAGRGLPEDLATDTRIPVGVGLAGSVAGDGCPLLVKDIRSEPFRGRESGGSYRGVSCLCLPLRAGTSVLGVLNLADKESGEPFTEEDLYLLGTLADPVAQALENAMRLRRMRALSIIDDLTGLYNRRHFRRALEREFRRAQRHSRPLTLSILDVDHFKLYNDLNGHEAGNRALRRIGELLRTSFRTSDIVCRYGGEEFAVVLPETEKGDTFVPESEDGTFGAFRFLDRLRARIEQARFENEQALPGGRLTISGGVASFPTDAATIDDLLEAADRSLYLAKAEGRNRVHIA